MLIALHIMESLYGNLDCVITAGCDGKHKDFSSHYSGNALDFRIHAFTREQATTLVASAQSALGEDFFVQLEADHIHVQYKPKGSLNG